jgi:KaiC/GvpD/RAD55 family RecA-like ATPase
MHVDEVLAYFPDAKRSGTGWTVRCPAHDDRTPSLTITTGDDGRTLLHCHAGCRVEDIVARVDLTMRDLFVDAATPSMTTPEIVQTYPYTAEDGTLLYESVRYVPKAFRQRRPNGRNGWIWKLDDPTATPPVTTPRVLLGLPELIDVTDIFIVEGEKDVRALQKLGLSATTNAGGAGQWRDDYAQQLSRTGALRVNIIPDNDEPGQTHAATVARSCHTAGIEARIVRLPDLRPKGDVSDYLDAGHTRDDLAALVTATVALSQADIDALGHVLPPAASETFTLTSIGDLLHEPEEEVNWLVEGLIPAKSVVVLAAKPKVGKSTAARSMALSVARGDTWLGRACAQGPVWYLAFEGRRQDIKMHFQQMDARDEDAISIFAGQAPRAVVREVQQLAECERPALIIIDTMQRFLRAKSTDDYAEMTTLLDTVIGIVKRSGATIMLLHHNGKAARATLDNVLGSTAIAGSADTVLLLSRTERYRTISTVQRTGPDLPETVLVLDAQTGHVGLGASPSDVDLDLVERAILVALGKTDHPLTEAEIEPLVEARTNLKRRALRELVCREHVSRTCRGGKGDPYRYGVTDSCSDVPL